jgi:hypothetical protein
VEDALRLETMVNDAKVATEAEHNMSLWQAIKRYPKASVWSLLISFAVVMEGERLHSLLDAFHSHMQDTISFSWATFTRSPSSSTPSGRQVPTAQSRFQLGGKLAWATAPMSAACWVSS